MWSTWAEHAHERGGRNKTSPCWQWTVRVWKSVEISSYHHRRTRRTWYEDHKLPVSEGEKRDLTDFSQKTKYNLSGVLSLHEQHYEHLLKWQWRARRAVVWLQPLHLKSYFDIIDQIWEITPLSDIINKGLLAFQCQVAIFRCTWSPSPTAPSMYKYVAGQYTLWPPCFPCTPFENVQYHSKIKMKLLVSSLTKDNMSLYWRNWRLRSSQSH